MICLFTSVIIMYAMKIFHTLPHRYCSYCLWHWVSEYGSTVTVNRQLQTVQFFPWLDVCYFILFMLSFGYTVILLLSLSVYNMKVVLLRELKRCSTFSKLTMLSLGEWCMAADFDALLVVLQQSPKLERLFLNWYVCKHVWWMLLDSISWFKF
jgi:hypothetical protein